MKVFLSVQTLASSSLSFSGVARDPLGGAAAHHRLAQSPPRHEAQARRMPQAGEGLEGQALRPRLASPTPSCLAFHAIRGGKLVAYGLLHGLPHVAEQPP